MEEGLPKMESPFASKFRTNFAPSPKEILDIQTILLGPVKELHVLDEQIAQLQTRRDQLKSFIDNHHALLSPIRRVPADILREIFVQCLPEDQLPTHNIHQAPLLLTGICQFWREVAITTPRLWNRIHIWLRYPRSPPITDFFRSLMKASEKGLDLWLERSGTMPLILSLCASTPCNLSSRWNFSAVDGGRVDDIETLYINFARHLLPHASRWKSLSISVTARVMSFLKALPEESELTSLEEFKPTQPLEIEMSWEALDVVVRRSPSICSIQLNDRYLQELSIPCGNLTAVVISTHRGDIVPYYFKRVLSPSCASLRHCTLDISIPIDSTILSVESSVVFPLLHTLEVQIESSQVSMVALALQHLFDAITAPMLERLHIIMRNHTFHRVCLDRLPLLPFLERSGCDLLSFALDLSVKVADLAAALPLMPSLVELKLWGSTITEASALLSEFFDALTPSPMDSDALCPRLESLTCVRCPASASASLLALAEARSCVDPRYPGVQKLKRMRVSLRDFVADPELPAKLKGLREQGMIVQWSSPPDLCRKLVNELEGSDGLPLILFRNPDWPWDTDPSATHFY